jgi:hypothetical protein
MYILLFKDISKVDLSEILNSHQIVSINVAASATAGKMLSSHDSETCLKTCRTIMELNENKVLNIEYV